VIEQQKDDMDSRNALVSIYVKNKQYNEVAELLKGTAELFPEDPNNHYKLGLIYEFKKDYENAIAGYKKATELKADHARSLNALGRLYMKTGRISEAKEVLEAAKKADPTLEETSVLLNNIRDEFNPAPQKINKKLKSSRSKKIKKGKKSKKSKITKKTKTGAKSSKPAAKKSNGT
jgi:tetratricopeptide (TPR) repeat protein